MSRSARSRKAAEPAHFVRNGNPFLPGASTRADRGGLRAAGAVHALAKAEAGGRAVRDPLEQASRAALDREAAGCGLTATGRVVFLSHRPELDAVQMSDRRHAEMIGAEHAHAAVELFLADIERDVADRPVGAARILP